MTGVGRLAYKKRTTIKIDESLDARKRHEAARRESTPTTLGARGTLVAVTARSQKGKDETFEGPSVTASGSPDPQYEEEVRG
ncbi:hypothetical protein [Streptomyces lateritius]|uniref:hypothetical protein n=1 Tax=Streptomyces lateritius TaxID=67313 RepID=UPI0016729997|nr:hypothetical protein [Streptomyces lateritius]